jgi:hypothetical protein
MQNPSSKGMGVRTAMPVISTQAYIHMENLKQLRIRATPPPLRRVRQVESGPSWRRISVRTESALWEETKSYMREFPHTGKTVSDAPTTFLFTNLVQQVVVKLLWGVGCGRPNLCFEYDVFRPALEQHIPYVDTEYPTYG